MSGLTRRDVLAGGLSLGCLAALPRSGHAKTAGAEQVAPGVYVRRGVDEDISVANANGIGNLGFIVGRDGVAIIDPGGSLADGERLRAAVRQITDRPVVYVVFTHVHPDHLFGAGAFLRDKPEFIAHERLPTALAQRGEYYRRRLEEVLGKGSAGPHVEPTLLVAPAKPLDLDLGGKPLRLTAHPLAHTDCDLTVLDQSTETVFLGDLLFVDRVPSLDGSLTGWIKELGALRASGARKAVPGHGPASVDWPAGAADLERYLGVLLEETRAAIAAGVPIEAAVERVGLSERGRWRLFEGYHGHNVTKAYKELEWE